LKVGLRLHYFYDIIEEGSKTEGIALKEPKKDDIYVIGYTSGTSGNPKGVMNS
jgi:long-subunit acyl-CoA synthetase (AMP-forming)